MPENATPAAEMEAAARERMEREIKEKMKTAEGRRELHGEDFNIGGKEAEAERLRLLEAERLRLLEVERLRLAEEQRSLTDKIKESGRNVLEKMHLLPKHATPAAEMEAAARERMEREIKEKMKTAEGRRELHGEDFNIGGKEAEAERLRLFGGREIKAFRSRKVKACRRAEKPY